MMFLKNLRSDRGASMMLVAMSLLLLMGAAAVAVDLAAMRMDRSADQKVTDSAAAAGALEALEGTGQDACETALEYVAINSEGIGSIDTSDCTADISMSCDPTMPESLSVSTGRYDITFVYPVDNNHELMASAQLGAPSQTVAADDGDPCERVGVQMSATHKSLFAQLLGFDQGTTRVHSVAIGFLPSSDGPPLNLLVLDRDGCDAILVEGNPQSGVIVNAVTDPDTGEVHPGVMAADSDASSATCSTTVMRMEGSNVELRADGPPGCPTELTPGTGEGCGLIQSLVADTTPSCTDPACTPGAGGSNPPDPLVTQLPERMTRAQIDYEYNCWGDYTNPPFSTQWAADPLTDANEQSIDPCTNGGDDHIFDYITEVGRVADGTPVGYTSWQGDLGHSCTIDAGDPDVILPPGDIHVDCAAFTVKRHVQITGDVVFDGDVDVTGGTGHLDVNNSDVSPGRAFFRGGELSKSGDADLTFDYTMVYMAKGSRVVMQGGDGTLAWRAPDSGEFDDLALWSDSQLTHEWAGQANLTMEGVFFTPWAQAIYRGTGGQNQTDAQWVAHRIYATGQGRLQITPKFEFPLKRDDTARTTIIR